MPSYLLQKSEVFDTMGVTVPHYRESQLEVKITILLFYILNMDIKERQALDSFEKMPLDMHAVVVLVQSSF